MDSVGVAIAVALTHSRVFDFEGQICKLSRSWSDLVPLPGIRNTRPFHIPTLLRPSLTHSATNDADREVQYINTTSLQGPLRPKAAPQYAMQILPYLSVMGMQFN